MISDRLYYLKPPTGGPGFFTKIADNLPEGFVLRRQRLFVGKDRLGMTWRIMRDPTYVDIDTWTKKHGFERIEFCPTAWLKDGSAELEADPEINFDFTTDEGIYAFWVQNHLAKKSRLAAIYTTESKVHTEYSKEDHKVLLKKYETLEHLYLMIPVKFQKASTGVHSTEVKRQEQMNLYQAVVFAWEHALKSEGNGITRKEVVAAVLERENRLIDEALQTARNVAKWDGVVETADTPDEVKRYFTRIPSIRPWSAMSDPEKRFFHDNLKAAKHYMQPTG